MGAPRGAGRARLAFVTGARHPQTKLPRRSAPIIGPGRGGGCFQILLNLKKETGSLSALAFMPLERLAHPHARLPTPEAEATAGWALPGW